MPEQQLPRDVRVDDIGYCGELTKRHADTLKTRVKICMLERGHERVAGDAFEGLLVSGAAVGTIDPARWLKLYEKGEISKAQFLSCLAVRNEPATEVLGGGDIAKISTFREVSPSLRVTRIKGVEIALVDALARLNDAIRGPVPGGGLVPA